MVKTLKNPIKKYTTKNILSAFGELDKTIIYCYSKNQASNFKRAFKNVGIEVLSSNSQNDIDSIEFNKFKEYDNYKVLLVVDRGKEGFDMPELFNIIDFTLSTNPEIILQILGRILRISYFQPNKTKAYYKVSPKNDIGYHYTILGGVLQLIQPGFYQNFTGDIKEIKIPLFPSPKKPKSDREKSPSLNIRAIQWFEQSGVPLSVNFWKEIKHKMGENFKTIAWTTLEDVRKTHFGVKSNWEDDELRQVAARFDNIKDMTADREGVKVLQIINKRDIWEDIAPHIQTEKRKGLSFDMCKKIVLTWKELPSRSKNSPIEDIKVYQRIFDRGWKELFDLVPKSKRGKKTKRSDDEVLKSARTQHWIKKGLSNKEIEQKEIEYQRKKQMKLIIK
jgi:superfamily II DNA/RNA helicase